jgi:hypothetical protein
MQIVNRMGVRYTLVLGPTAATSFGVPPPFTVDGFLGTFAAEQRRQMVTALAANPRFTDLGPAITRARPNDVQVTQTLKAMLSARRIALTDAQAQAPQSARTGAESAPSRGGQPAPPATPPPVAAAVVCELLAVEAACAHHGRKANRAGLLEVVPEGDDDLIQLKSTLRGGCGEHPHWAVRSPFSSTVEKTGVSSSFVAKSWGFKALGIFEVQPKSYFVNCSCCTGMSKQLEVRAYPLDAWDVDIGIDFKKSPLDWSVKVKITPWEETSLTLKTDVLKKFNDKSARMKWALDKVMVPLVGSEGKFEFLKTKLKFAGKWAENPSDHRVFYKYSAALEFAPLLKGEFTIPFGPTSAIPGWIKKWTTDLIGDLYLYLKFEGEVKLSGTWSRTSADVSSAVVTGSGKIGVKAGGNLFLMKKSALNLDVNGGTDITAEAKAPVSRTPAVEYDLKWGGLEIEITIEAAWGLVEYKRKWKPIAGFSLLEKMLGHKPEPWYPLGQ